MDITATSSDGDKEEKEKFQSFPRLHLLLMKIIGEEKATVQHEYDFLKIPR